MAGRHHEVVVIGAGIAGLRCAEQLIREKGVTDVLVVEALDRVGGRILSTTDFIPGMIVDIGAELVHGANTSLRKLAEQQNWSVREIFTWAQGDGGPHDMAPDGGIGYYYLGDQKRMLAYDDEDADFCAFNKAVGALGEIDINGIPASASVLEYFEGLNLSESMIKLAEAGYANTAGSRLEDISWRVTSRYEGQLKKQVCGESRLQSTFARVVDYVKEGVDIQLQFAVKSIDYSDRETIIVTSTNDERISCSKLVVTVPVSVFMDIEYMPALPQYKREAAESFGMRRAAKVLMHFNDSFWPSNTHGVICSDCFMPEFWVNSTAGIGHLVENGDSEADSGSETDSDNVQYLVTGFAGAECAEMLLEFSEQEIVDRFLAQLNMIYGTEDEPTPATKCFVRGMYFDWGNVEYIRGGYGFPRVGQSDHAAKDLASAIDNRIFFAGEATAFEQPGMTVHSALDTGTRAADEVAKAVAP